MLQSAVIRHEYEFKGHNAVLNAVCYNRHQDCFVSADDSSLRLWSAARPSGDGGQQRHVSLPPRTTNFIQAIEYVDSRQMYVASALDGTLRLYDHNLNELAAIFTGRAAILSLVFDSKHSRLLTGGVDGCGAWQVRGKPLAVAEGPLNPQYEFSPLPKFFHGHGGWNADKPTASTASPKSPSSPASRIGSNASTAQQHQNAVWVRSVQLNSDKSRLYAQSLQCIDVFGAADGQFLERYADLFPAEHGAITAFVVHERSQYIVVGSMDGAIFVLSLHPTSVVHAFKDHTTTVTSLAVHASSSLIVSSSLDGTMRLWDLETRRQVHRLDLGQPVQALQLLSPLANPCRFYCRVRSSVRIFRIHSTIKEHMACLAPISILTRVIFPSLVTPGASADDEHTGRHGNRRSDHLAPGIFRADSDDDSDDDDDDDSVDRNSQQLIVAAGTDKTIRVFAGHTANEAPSFTWIPEENALDLIGFAFHPIARRLFLLLESQRLLIVDASAQWQQPEDDGSKRRSVERVVNFGMPAPMTKLAGAPHASTKGDAGSQQDGPQPPPRPPQPQSQSQPQTHPHQPSQSDRGAGKEGRRTSIARNPGRSNSRTTVDQRDSTVVEHWNMRGALKCISVCHFPPVFHAATPLGELTSIAADEDAPKSKWFSRVRRQGTSSLAKELRKTEAAPRRKPAQRRGALVKSDWEWVVCGTELGHLLFWHTGLGDNGTREAISLDAHESTVVAVATSVSSPLLASLDEDKRVNLWQLQPTLALRHLLDLNEKPTCFVLSPRSELVLAGFEDGTVTLTDASDLDAVETFTGDENHFAMVSAGDFLDEKAVVLTASVDAIVKIWDQQKILLRQVTISSALTSLCFMNQHGDVMAGLPAGIFVISRNDVLPEKLLDSPTSLSGGSRKRKPRMRRPNRDAVSSAASNPRQQREVSPSRSTPAATETITSAEGCLSPSATSENSGVLDETPLTPHRRPLAVRFDALAARVNDRALAAACMQHAPVLRPLPAVRRADTLQQQDDLAAKEDGLRLTDPTALFPSIPSVSHLKVHGFRGNGGRWSDVLLSTSLVRPTTQLRLP